MALACPGQVARRVESDFSRDFSPIELDRQLARAFTQWRAWRLRLRDRPEGGEEDDPLTYFHPVTGLEQFRRLSELPEYDPLRGPARRWVYRLAEQRINHGALTALGEERQKELRLPDAPGRGAVSLATMLERCLSDAPRAEVWMQLFLGNAAPVSTLTVDLWQRRREIARRMGLDSPAVIESCLADADTAHTAGANAAVLAELVARSTRERIRELELASPAGFVEVALGRDVPGSWPARLSPQRMLDYFRDGDLLRSLDLKTPPLPSSLGAASFMRSLGILGGAWLEALGPQDQPFVVAHDPYGLKRHEASALFSLLPLNSRFLGRHLEIPPHALPDVRRRLAQIWLLELGLTAFRVQLRPHALAGESSFREAFVELVHRDLDLSVTPNIAGALFPLGIEDEQHLVGQLLAVEREEALLEAHDEDWFRNPRAIEQLRAEANRPPLTRAEPNEVKTALARTLKRLELLLR